MRKIPPLDLTLIDEPALFKMYEAIRRAGKTHQPKVHIVMELVKRNKTTHPEIIKIKYNINPDVWEDYKHMYKRFYE
jgi:hypothetical protein